MNAVISKYFPNPLRYKQMWHLARGVKPLYAWKPIPPDGFIALGVVCTTSEVPPSIDAVHCVPSRWCMVTKFNPVKIWDDSGAGGGRPGSIWIINPHGLITLVPGHDAPKDCFHELLHSSFPLEELGIPE